jgi:hypothetical protein
LIAYRLKSLPRLMNCWSLNGTDWWIARPPSAGRS